MMVCVYRIIFANFVQRWSPTKPPSLGMFWWTC